MARPPKLNDRVTLDGAADATGQRTQRKVLRRDAVLELVRQGCTHKVAALRAGISESTFYAWVSKGKAAKSGLYRDFADDLELAEAVAEGTLTLQMRAHAARDWRATAWMLERRFPETWKEQREIVLQHEVPSMDAPEVIRQRITDNRRRLILLNGDGDE